MIKATRCTLGRIDHGHDREDPLRTLIHQRARRRPTMTTSAAFASLDESLSRRLAGVSAFLALVLAVTLCPAAHGRVWVDTGPPGSGSTLPLVLDPSNPATIYTASSGARVQKSTDGGQSWSETS